MPSFSYSTRTARKPRLGQVRKALRRSPRTLSARALVLGGMRPTIFDPLGARVTRRTFTPGGVVRAGRNVRLF